MLTEELQHQIKESVTDFVNICLQYRAKQKELQSIHEDKTILQKELEELGKKEKLEDMFSQAVYLQTTETSKAEQIQNQLEYKQSEIGVVSTTLEKSRTKILKQAKSLRFPIDLRRLKKVNGQFEIAYFEDIALEEEALKVLSELLDLDSPLKYEGVTYLKDGIILGADSHEEALEKVVNSVQSLRLLIDNQLNVYSSIDEFCNRIHGSHRYAITITELFKASEPIELEELSRRTGIDRSTLYQALYDLASRSNWNPHPVKKMPDGRYDLTNVGRLVMNRYVEKYQEPLPLKKE